MEMNAQDEQEEKKGEDTYFTRSKKIKLDNDQIHNVVKPNKDNEQILSKDQKKQGRRRDIVKAKQAKQ